jgi:Putative zinc-finger
MSVEHTDVGAYALGLLDDDDRGAFERHLRDCAACAAELSGLAPMGALLSGVDPAAVEDEEPEDRAGEVANLLARRRRADRRRRRGTVVIGLAAGVAVVAGGVAVGSAVVSPGGRTAHRHGSPAADVLARGARHTATDPTTHVHGVVATRAAPFGTEVGLDLAGVRGPLTCRLVAVLRSGGRQAVTEWAVPAAGYGVPGSPAHLQVHGGVAASVADVSRFDVLVEGGGRLVSIPV